MPARGEKWNNICIAKEIVNLISVLLQLSSLFNPCCDSASSATYSYRQSTDFGSIALVRSGCCSNGDDTDQVFGAWMDAFDRPSPALIRRLECCVVFDTISVANVVNWWFRPLSRQRVNLFVGEFRFADDASEVMFERLNIRFPGAWWDEMPANIAFDEHIDLSRSVPGLWLAESHCHRRMERANEVYFDYYRPVQVWIDSKSVFRRS